jgi:ATP-dependent DNA helicase RecQ
LCGAKIDKIIERNHHKLSVYGIVNDFSKDDLKCIFDQLLSRDLVVKSGDEYPTFALSPSGNVFLQKREKLILPKLKSPAKLLTPVDNVKVEYDQELFKELRLLRKKIADDKGVPAFVVFGDLALLQMAFYLPQSEESFAKISGVGSEKLKQYGKIFTEAIKSYARVNNLNEKDIPLKRSRK